MSTIEELNKDTLEIIKKYCDKISDMCISANQDLDNLETLQQNKKYEIENKLTLIKLHSDQLRHLATTKYRLELRMQQLKQNGVNLKWIYHIKLLFQIN